jgi:hypothetical protein
VGARLYVDRHQEKAKCGTAAWAASECLIWLLVLIVLIPSIAALAKYLRN